MKMGIPARGPSDSFQLFDIAFFILYAIQGGKNIRPELANF